MWVRQQDAPASSYGGSNALHGTTPNQTVQRSDVSLRGATLGHPHASCRQRRTQRKPFTDHPAGVYDNHTTDAISVTRAANHSLELE